MKYSMEKKEKIKLIFLDYDGVVNNLVFHDINGEPTFYTEKGDNGERDECVNDFQAIAWLNKICREFNCKIVVSSTWRGRDDYKECLYKAGLNENVEILGRTPWISITPRGYEIAQWLYEHQDLEIEDFIILDDDADMKFLNGYLIQTNTYRGLGFEEYQRVCQRWEEV